MASHVSHPSTYRAITLMAMSGVGKTHLSKILMRSGWQHYYCDYIIASKLQAQGMKGVIAPDNLKALSAYIGQVGKGALSLEEFKKRQAQYNEAEKQTLADVGMAIKMAGKNFACDSTGSLCEIEDEALMEKLAKETMFVYIKAGPEAEQALLARAAAHPKPLYYPPAQFDGWLKEYMDGKTLGAVDEIEPDDFSRWVFPKLFHARLPKYQRLADQYGVTIPAARLKEIHSAEDFLRIIDDKKG